MKKLLKALRFIAIGIIVYVVHISFEAFLVSNAFAYVGIKIPIIV